LKTNVKIPQHLSSDDWVRLPKPGDRFMELTRSTLLEIVTNPKSGVKSAVIRSKPERQRGIRLIYLPSLLAYFERLADEEKSRALSRKKS
jgi:hypothetical protein